MLRGGIAAFAVSVCALVAALGAAARPEASAWKKLPQGPLTNSTEASLARTADGRLHAAFPRFAPGSDDIWSVTIGATGSVGAAPVVQGWAATNNPALVAAPDGLHAFFGGTRSINANETNRALNTATAPAAGAPWSLQSGAVGDPSSTAYQSPVAAARTKDGSFVEAWYSTFGLDYNYGTTQGTPSVRIPGNCCYYDPGLAVDSVSGDTVLAWYSNEAAAPGAGVFLQQISPEGPVGKRQLAPGSVAANGKDALAPLNRTPVSGRLGAGGVYLAYGAGYPTFTSVRLLRFGASKPALVVPAKSAFDVELAAAPEGRLWLFWKDAAGTTVRVTRTNRAVTGLEPIQSVPAPPGTDTIWKLAGDGALGPLDLVANVQTSDAAFWYRRVLARLSLHGSALGNRRARFVVTDAGDPLAGARVAVRGRVVQTNAGGVASVTLARGRATAVATKAGYAPASASVVVR